MTSKSNEDKSQPAKRGPKSTKFRKAPQAPKRFKSAFIFFSIAKHPEIREQKKYEKKTDNAAPNVAKLVSEAWRNLPQSEREVWIKMAEDDKKRYEVERAMYTGPWKVPAPKRAKKNPDAPKRPMSAFLAYSKDMRSQAKKENAHLSNTEVSRLLATMWNGEKPEIKEEYKVREAAQRGDYKLAIEKWRVEEQTRVDTERKRREDVARNVIASGGYETARNSDNNNHSAEHVHTHPVSEAYYQAYDNTANGANESYGNMHHYGPYNNQHNPHNPQPNVAMTTHSWGYQANTNPPQYPNETYYQEVHNQYPEHVHHPPSNTAPVANHQYLDHRQYEHAETHQRNYNNEHYPQSYTEASQSYSWQQGEHATPYGNQETQYNNYDQHHYPQHNPQHNPYYEGAHYAT